LVDDRSIRKPESHVPVMGAVSDTTADVTSARATAFILEDDPLTLELVSVIVQTSTRYDARPVAPSIPDLQDALRQSRPEDLFIIDVMLGRAMDGFEACQVIRDTRFSGRLLLISGRDPLYLEHLLNLCRGFGLNVVGALPKPLDQAKLVALIEGD